MLCSKPVMPVMKNPKELSKKGDGMEKDNLSYISVWEVFYED